MKYCQKPSFALCLRIINSLAKNSLLTESEFTEISDQANQIKEVIEHRKLPNKASEPREKKLDEEINQILY
jgi:hypothetical protein